MIYIENKKKPEAKLKEKYPNAVIADVTSKATNDLIKLSPFYPHGEIPIPFSKNQFAMSVEGIWQGLKVFEIADIDIKMFQNQTMKNLKRTVRKFGKTTGHRKGVNGKELLDYISARVLIYLPSYLWVLENKVQHILKRMQETNFEKDIILLDYTTNDNVLDPSRPLSHAYLIKAYIEGTFPTESSLMQEKSTSTSEVDVRISSFTEFKPSVKEEKTKKEKFGRNNQLSLFDDLLEG